MTQPQDKMRDTLREYARERLQQAMLQTNASTDPLPETCQEYDHECVPTDKLNELRGIIDRPHRDDSPCENPIWEAIDDVLNAVITGFEQAIEQ